ncbi:hypothetical protein KJ654_03750 [Patescibacteria group bacterium]|nr:hypothetical protein [Patescibacteria group bacterium]MBU1966871.1 hypothetical protein [Patescibacteria group bacterium]
MREGRIRELAQEYGCGSIDDLETQKFMIIEFFNECLRRYKVFIEDFDDVKAAIEALGSTCCFHSKDLYKNNRTQTDF